MNEEFSDLMQQRLEKVRELRAKNINPYPIRYKRDTTAAAIKDGFDEANPKQVRVAGRIRSKRVMGKATFAHIEDLSGSVQIYATADHLGAEAYDFFTTLDLGDKSAWRKNLPHQARGNLGGSAILHAAVQEHQAASGRQGEGRKAL
jgi:lysyl-tRNA synthetase class II